MINGGYQLLRMKGVTMNGRTNAITVITRYSWQITKKTYQIQHSSEPISFSCGDLGGNHERLICEISDPIKNSSLESPD